MSLISQIWTIERQGRLHSYVTTNVETMKLLAHLRRRRVLDSVETVHAYFGDRAEGGCGYEILWKSHLQWSDLSEIFRKL